MAFETIRSASGVDFIGTDEVDALFAINETGNKYAGGREAADIIQFQDNIAQIINTLTVRGGQGNDTITMVDTVDTSFLAGDDGDDTITTAGASNSTISGLDGNDTIRLNGNYTNALINGNAGGDAIAETGDLFLANTRILGGEDNDSGIAIGNTAANDFTAVSSAINGNKGNDTIRIGGAGGTGTFTNFTIFGGQGSDTIVNLYAAADITISGDLGNDNITSSTGDDTLIGGEGNDTVVAGGGDDSIVGNQGDDVLTGDAGDDTIVGGQGDDVITGGAGANDLTGSLGADTFADAATAGANTSWIITSIEDSAAAVSGATRTFDSITGAAAAGAIDITAVATALAGGALTGGVVAGTTFTTGAASLNDTTIASFAELKTLIDGLGTAVASSTTNLAVNFIDLTGNTGALGTGIYAWVNDTQVQVNVSDLMFQQTALGNITAASFTAA